MAALTYDISRHNATGYRGVTSYIQDFWGTTAFVSQILVTSLDYFISYLFYDYVTKRKWERDKPILNAFKGCQCQNSTTQLRFGDRVCGINPDGKERQYQRLKS